MTPDVTPVERPSVAPPEGGAPRWSVVVCAYTWDRLEQTTDCLRAVLAQPERPEVILVVDHNDSLEQAMRARFPAVDVVPNRLRQGLGGARNAGVARASGELVAFVDDDAVPSPTWLAELGAPFDDPGVSGVGGRVDPAWVGRAPGWFPPEFLWVVGCSYDGMTLGDDVRNPLGCNMAFRRSELEAIGGFDLALGRLGNLPFGLEETELCVRLRARRPQARISMLRGAAVSHHVPRDRQAFRYLVQRCYFEGIGKALLSDLATSAALGSERSYALRVLPRAALRETRRALVLDRPAARVGRVVAMAAGLGAAGLGYAVGRMRLLARTRVGPEAVSDAHD